MMYWVSTLQDALVSTLHHVLVSTLHDVEMSTLHDVFSVLTAEHAIWYPPPY